MLTRASHELGLDAAITSNENAMSLSEYPAHRVQPIRPGTGSDRIFQGEGNAQSMGKGDHGHRVTGFYTITELLYNTGARVG
jgi:hypothetical protein